MLVVAVEECDPFIVLFQACFLDVTQIYAAFLEAGLEHLNILLSQLQFQTRYLTSRIEFTKVLVLSLDIQLEVLSLGLQIHFGCGDYG